MSKIGFPSNPNNGRSYTWRSRRRFNFDSARGGWTASGGNFEGDVPALNSNTSIADFNDSTGLANKLTGKAQVCNTYADLPTEAYKGTFAYTSDTNKLYIWTGDNPAPPTALYGDRGMFMGGGGQSSITTRTIEWMSLVTGGDASSFAYTFNVANAACSTTNGQRAVTVGLSSGSNGVTYISIPNPSVETYSGSWLLQKEKAYSSATSDTVYGVFFTISGDDTVSATDAIEYITIDTTGSSTIFGDLTEATSRSGDSAASDGSRGIHAGGTLTVPFTENGYVDTIVYITIATPSNASDFGNLTEKRAYLAACHDDTRAVFTGGANYIYGGQGVDTTEYVTIATTANATDFGTLDTGLYEHGSTSNGTYGYTVGGWKSGASSPTNEVKQFTIQTNATSTDFADLTQAKTAAGTTSGFAS